LEPVSQNAQQEVAGQVRGRSSPENGVPASLKVSGVKITYARDLDVECVAVRQGRTNLHAYHVA
jgi:hypothetical protein